MKDLYTSENQPSYIKSMESPLRAYYPTQTLREQELFQSLVDGTSTVSMIYQYKKIKTFVTDLAVRFKFNQKYL